MSRFRTEHRNWTDYRHMRGVIECDFHRGRRIGKSYEEAMSEVAEQTLAVLQYAQAKRYTYVLFRHGCSTSGLGQTTARSAVRGVMRSPESTPHTKKSQCIQHESVFLAAIKPGEYPTPHGVWENSYNAGPNGQITMLFFEERP